MLRPWGIFPAAHGEFGDAVQGGEFAKAHLEMLAGGFDVHRELVPAVISAVNDYFPLSRRPTPTTHGLRRRRRGMRELG